MDLFTSNSSLISLILVSTIFLVDLIIRIVLLFYVPRNRKPTSAMAWLLAIYIVPIIGAIIFFIIGNTKLSKARRQKQAYMSKKLRSFARLLKTRKITAPIR